MNNHKITPRNTRKHFFTFILISGVAAVTILLVIIFLVKTSSKDKNKQINEKHPTFLNNRENNSKANISEQNQISLQDIENCPYLNESEFTTIDPKRKYSKFVPHEADLIQWRQIPSEFIVSGWKKGYHWRDILQLWEWKISEAEVPDLTTKQRIGVINSLAFSVLPPAHILDDENCPKEELIKMIEEEKFGLVKDLVVIVRKITQGGPKINLDKGIAGASPFGNTQKYSRKLIIFTLNQENLDPSQYEIFLLNCIGANQKDERLASNSIGKSYGSAIYLALLSALHQKPIAKSVAATGTIRTSLKKKSGKVNNQEVNLVPGDNLPIVGLKGKSYAAVEKGVDRLVLSAYNVSPNLLNQLHKTNYYDEHNKHITEKWSLAEDYQQVVPPEIREKMTVYWTKNISELRELVLGGKLS